MGTLQLIATDGSTSHCIADPCSAGSSHTPAVNFGSGFSALSRQSSKGSLHLNPPYTRPESPFAPSGGSERTPESGRLVPRPRPWSGGSGHGFMRSEPLTTMLHHRLARSWNRALSQQSMNSMAPHLGRINYRTIPRCAPTTFSPRSVGLRRRMSSICAGGAHDVSLGDASFLDGVMPMAPAMELNRVWMGEAIGGQTECVDTFMRSSGLFWLCVVWRDFNDRQAARAFLYKDFSEKRYVCILAAGSLRFWARLQSSCVVWSNCLIVVIV